MRHLLFHLKIIPNTGHISKYLFIISAALGLYFFPIFKHPLLNASQSTMCNVSLLICALTLNANETKRYFKLTKTLSKTIFLSFLLILSTIFLQTLLIKFSPVSDPQNLSRFIYDFSPSYFTHQIIKYIFVGIGEEILKLFIFFVIYWTLQKLTHSSHFLFNSLLAITCTSFIFGFLHVTYQPQNWVYIVIPIAFGAIINFYFLFQFGSIIPLMVAHAIKDILVFISLMNGFGMSIYILLTRFIFISTLLLFIHYQLKKDT